MTDLESPMEIENFIRSNGDIPQSNYFVAEKSWKPSLQLRGSNSYIWTYFSRKPYLLIFTEKELILHNYWGKSNDKNRHIPLREIKNFDIEILTPFNEYCLSFEHEKKFYFYIKSKENILDKISDSEEFSLKNFNSLIEKNFFGLLNS
ncbi:MAG: hypothetical protein LBE23_00835 [Vagococcus sp.]|jgi:hypothetical protein|nr:hypothetical protein [Vagococcus sp.]